MGSRAGRDVLSERIHAVQKMFWALCAVSAVLCVMGLPLGNDGETMDALNELQTFERGFDRATLERGLVSHASLQGSISLQDVVAALDKRGVPKVSAAAGAAPVLPRATVTLDTLEAVNALGQPDASVELAFPSATALALSLGWRLSLEEGNERYELQQIALGEQRCGQDDVARESAVADARKEAMASRASAKTAEKRQEQAEALYDQRRKWKASWKAISKANENRLEAQATLVEAQASLADKEGRYAALAKQARAPALGAAGDCVLATATLIGKPSGKTLALTLPTPIERRPVSVPRLTGVDFPVLQTAGLWDTLKASTAAQAIATVRDRFSWHYRYIELGPVKLGTMTLLQFAPLLLLPLFLGLIRKSRGVGGSYNPFDRPAGEVLPSVGLGTDAANVAVLIVLPLIGCVLCAVSLAAIDEPPIVPGLCVLAALGLGGKSHLALKELMDLREAITRSHSNPPPMPSAPAH